MWWFMNGSHSSLSTTQRRFNGAWVQGRVQGITARSTQSLILGLQPPHHLLHPFLPDVGVNLGGADALVPQQGLDVHSLGPGVEQVRA
jgi:hypothetical protein